MQIVLQPFGVVANDILDNLGVQLHSSFGCPVSVNSPLPVISSAYDPARKQYLADLFIDTLKKAKNFPGKILGITEVDLFTNGFSYVFGQADTQADTAVISLHLLHQEHYGFPEDPKLLQERALKEAVHELGHTFGMHHCHDSRCVMHFSNSLVDSDYKSLNFCQRCQPRLNL